MRCFHDTFCNYVFGLLFVCGRVGRHGPLLPLLCKVIGAVSTAVASLLEINHHGVMIAATFLVAQLYSCWYNCSRTLTAKKETRS